jgi:hypothetical protein
MKNHDAHARAMTTSQIRSLVEYLYSYKSEINFFKPFLH